MSRILADISPVRPWDLPTHSCSEDAHVVSDPDQVSNCCFVYPITYQSEAFQSYDLLLQSDGRTVGLLSFRELHASFKSTLNHPQFGKVQSTIETKDMKKVSLNDAEWSLCTSFYEALFNARWRRRTGRKRFRFNGHILDGSHPVPNQNYGLNRHASCRIDDLLNHACDQNQDELDSSTLLLCKEEHDQDPFPLYIVVSLTNQGHLDYDRMKSIVSEYNRSDEERGDSVHNLDENTPPRLWTPIYSPNTTYVAFHPNGSYCSEAFPNEAYSNYTDYYQQKWSTNIALDCPLIKAHHIWDLPKGLRAVDEVDLIESYRDILLPRDACVEAPIADASIILHSTFLPQVLYQLERVETVSSFLEYSSKHIPPLHTVLKSIPVERLLEALTAKSCLLDSNYDRLEYLGDAVLKLIQSHSLLNCGDLNLKRWMNCLHEGDLSALRTAMGCNDRLTKTSEIFLIKRFILVRPLDRSLWLPPLLQSFMDTDDKDVKETIARLGPSDGIQADVIEALLGLIYLQDGFDSATHIAEILGLALPKDERPCMEESLPLSSKIIECTRKFLGVQIANRALLDEALTHPTVINSSMNSYQRLEWLGDAVLCIAAREWLYKTFPTKTVKELVPLEATMVSNEALAWLGFRSDIHRYGENGENPAGLFSCTYFQY